MSSPTDADSRAMPPQGDPALVAVDRALEELRHGRAVAVIRQAGAGEWRLVLALETAPVERVSWLLARGAELAVTRERAFALGAAPCDSDGVLLPLPAQVAADRLLSLGQCWEVEGWRAVLGAAVDAIAPADELAAAAVQLAKLAQLLPALLVCVPANGALPPDVLAVTPAQIGRHAMPVDADVQRVSEARVPLMGDIPSHFVLFRDRRDASEHVAVVVGAPNVAGVVPVRVHSSCFTGDLMGSLRCDCGEQLHTAVARLHAAGGGVLLYLAQEGRGIGLANKLRAYQLQDEGLDTVDANQRLGFSADERDYGIAAAMLRSLGITRIRLLSNSPQKVSALRSRGIEVTAIEKLPGTPNVHNERYLRTKRERAGHL
ncbi:MAG: GTP cyclohydrolase II [Steroidobacteraceae bacterium]